MDTKRFRQTVVVFVDKRHINSGVPFLFTFLEGFVDAEQMPLFFIADEVVVTETAVYIYRYLCWWDGSIELQDVYVITGD